MAARPPTNDIGDEPDSDEFGIVAIDAAVEDWGLSFPVTREELAADHGDESVAVDPSGHEMSLETALEQCEVSTFDTKQELLNALHPVFEERREKLSGGIVGRLRALLPF